LGNVGYSLTYLGEKIVSDIKKIKENDIVTTKFQNGYLKAQVLEIKEENHGDK
jgi:exonuclease VII large subunit